MKSTLFFILYAASALPCTAQWKNAGYDPYSIIAFSIHDSTLFLSASEHLYRWKGGEADSGIGFSGGNIVTFASLGRYFFANAQGVDQFTFRTSNNGSNWQEIGGAVGIGSNGAYLFGNYEYFGIHYLGLSRDSGQTWDSVANFVAKQFSTISKYIYANTGTALWRSTDTGNTWSQLTSAPFAGTMTVMDSLLFVIGGGKVIKSTNLGLDWVPITVDTAGETETVSALVTDGKNLFVGTSHSGIFLSRDSGTTWKAINDSLPISFYPLHVTAMGVFDTLLFADLVSSDGGTYNLFVRSIKELADTGKNDVQSVSQPPADTLEVFPNPALGIVTIRSGSTSILGVNVLNLLGENVLEVPNTYQSELALDISKLASGTYLLRIQTSNGIAFRKIVKEE